MKRSGSRRGSALSGLLPLLAAATVVAGVTPADSHAQGFGRGGGRGGVDCYRDDFAGRRASLEGMSPDQLQDVINRCRAAASSLDRTQREIIYAYFYAGKASRLLGESRGALPPSADIWREAASSLEIVAAFNGPRTNPKSPAADIAFERTWVEANLELAQVYLRQGRFVEAVRRARDITGAFPSESDPRHIRARFVLAQVYQKQTPPDEEQAMDALRVFTQRSLDADPYAAEARRQVFQIASKLGDEALKEGSPDSLRRAQAAYTKAREAAEAANALNPSALPIGDTFINLGRVAMLTAGARGPDAPGGCDGRTVDFDRLTTALELFRLAGATPEAFQWAGCAHMALGNLDEAVNSFKRAAAANTATTQLSLARALSRRAGLLTGVDAARNWAEAGRAYDSAIGMMQGGDAAKTARVLVEAADFDFAYLKWLGDNDAQKPPVIDHAIAVLRQAKQLAPTSAAPVLRLGMIYLGEGDFEGRRNLERGPESARPNLEAALRFASQDTDTRAAAHYYLSRLEVQKFLAGQVPATAADRKKNEDSAVLNADRAADLGADEKTATYFSQACETRLIYRRADSEGVRFCVADEGRDRGNYANSLLYEGLYFLRKAKSARTGEDRDAGLEQAYIAFDKGVNRLQLQGDTSSTLLAQMVTGRGVALGCAGFRRVGGEEITSVPVALKDQAKQIFERYDVRVCPVARR